VPLRRVNQAYVIATSTSVDVGGVDVAKFDDGYFKAEKKERTKKGEDGFFADATPEPKARRALTLPNSIKVTPPYRHRCARSAETRRAGGGPSGSACGAAAGCAPRALPGGAAAAEVVRRSGVR